MKVKWIAIQVHSTWLGVVFGTLSAVIETCNGMGQGNTKAMSAFTLCKMPVTESRSVAHTGSQHEKTKDIWSQNQNQINQPKTKSEA